MADRPIIFSAPMVRALLAGRKTQTRRLATSPLRRCEAGDRLYVREAWHAARSGDAIKPSNMDPSWDIEFAATARSYAEIGLKGRLRPGMHMPRWASRLTLIVEDVRVEPLQSISEADASAEGVTPIPLSDGPYLHTVAIDGGNLSAETAALTFKLLWSVLHGEQSWQANPDVLALTFRVERENIDRLGA